MGRLRNAGSRLTMAQTMKTWSRRGKVPVAPHLVTVGVMGVRKSIERSVAPVMMLAVCMAKSKTCSLRDGHLVKRARVAHFGLDLLELEEVVLGIWINVCLAKRACPGADRMTLL